MVVGGETVDVVDGVGGESVIVKNPVPENICFQKSLAKILIVKNPVPENICFSKYLALPSYLPQWNMLPESPTRNIKKTIKTKT